MGIANSWKSSLKRAFWTKFLKMGRAAFEPVSNFPKVFGLSKPTYTPMTKLELYPINQASKLLLVVPVLPAIGTFKSFNFFPVPLVITPFKIDVI